MRTTGGILANPASQYSFFRHVAFFEEYPYALPGFVSGAFCLSTAILSFISLDEVSIDPKPVA
jgi:ABC-type arginine transport system permease subunit